MIPDFKTYLKESLWADVQSQASGDVIKKEDEFDKDTLERIRKNIKIAIKWFVDYVVYNSKFENTFDGFKKYMDSSNYVDYYDSKLHCKGIDIVRPYIERNWDKGDNYKEYIDEKISEEEKKIKDLGYVVTNKPICDVISDWWMSLKDGDQAWISEVNGFDEYCSEYYSEGGSRWTELTCDDWWDSLSNYEALVIYMEYKDKVKTNESLWADVQSQASGESVKKEDNVNNLDVYGFFEYIKSHYDFDENEIDMEILEKKHTIFDGDVISIPFSQKFPKYNCMYYDVDNHNIYFHNTFITYLPNLYKKLENNLRIIHSKPNKFYIQVEHFIDEGSNSFCLELLDFMIENMDDDNEPLITKKNLTESLWADVQSQASGETVKKEDDINNLDFSGMYKYFYKHYPIYTDTEGNEIHISCTVGLYGNYKLLNIGISFRPKSAKPGDSYYYQLLRVFFEKDEKTISQLGVSNMTHTAIDMRELKKIFKGYTIRPRSTYDLRITPRKGMLPFTNRMVVDSFNEILKLTDEQYYQGEMRNVRKYIGVDESLWADVQSQASGTAIKKEDNINILDGSGLVEYIKRHYESLLPDEKTFIIRDINGRITIRLYHLLDYAMLKTGDYVYLEYEPEKQVIYISQYAKIYKYPIFSKLCRKFDVKRNNYHTHFANETTIEPKDGSEVTNQLFIDVIDFFEDNAEHPFYKSIAKKEKLDESLWADIQNQAAGTTIKKEDDIDIMDAEAFYEWLKKNYDSKDMSVYTSENSSYTYVTLIDFPDQTLYRDYYPENTLTVSKTIKDNVKIYTDLCEKYTVTESSTNSEYFDIRPKPLAKVTNTFFVEVLDYIIDKYSDKLDVHHKL